MTGEKFLYALGSCKLCLFRSQTTEENGSFHLGDPSVKTGVSYIRVDRARLLDNVFPDAGGLLVDRLETCTVHN